MLIVWGKRTYGSVQRVENVSVKTVFGHLWYLPLFPINSYYIERKTKTAYELNGLHGRSVLCGYLRVWLPLAIFIALVTVRDPGSDELRPTSVMFIVAALAALAGSYLYDKKTPLTMA